MAEGRAATRRRTTLQALLGIALGLAIATFVLRAQSRAKAPPPPEPSAKLAGTVLREDEGSIDEVLLHYVPKLEPLVDEAYRDFLGTLDPSARVVVVVPKGAVDSLTPFLARIDPSGALAARTRTVEVDGPI